MTVKNDKHIHQDVLRELRWDSRVEETEVGVEVEGILTADDLLARVAEERQALDAVTGVLRVICHERW